MAIRRHFSGLLLLATLAALGGLLVYIPGQVAQQYEVVRQWGRLWVSVYFTVVGIGATLLLIVVCMVAWRLWSNSIRKRRRKERRNMSPNSLSSGEREREILENLAEVVPPLES